MHSSLDPFHSESRNDGRWLKRAQHGLIGRLLSVRWKPGLRLTTPATRRHLWGAANILRGKTSGQDYNHVLSLMFCRRLCDQWEYEADHAIAELERQQGRALPRSSLGIAARKGGRRAPARDLPERPEEPLGLGVLRDQQRIRLGGLQ
jgi:type I restriction enzyme M protein